MEKSQHLRVLVVDDEPLIRWSLAETLQHAGHTVEEAGSATQTLDALSHGFVPDVVLLDFRLPDSNDLDLLRRIRSLVPASAVVMMTAFSTPEMIADAKKLGVYDVIHKPVDINDLASLVIDSHAAAPARLNGH
jgi:DNA-binding NtrC family response regulator